jgi:hypothetical protein
MDPQVIRSLTGLLVPLFGMLLPIIIIAIVMYGRHVNSRQRHELIGRLIEKGLPIPPELLAPQTDLLPAKSSRPGKLLWPMTMIGAGVGLIIYLVVEGGDNWGIGAIPLTIGLAQLLAWKLERKADSGATDDKP